MRAKSWPSVPLMCNKTLFGEEDLTIASGEAHAPKDLAAVSSLSNQRLECFLQLPDP